MCRAVENSSVSLRVKRRVILSRLSNNLAIWLGSVQGAEPTFERKAPSKPELVQPCQRLSKRHIEIRYDRKILFCARYLVQQKAGKRDGEQQQDYCQAKNLCCDGLPERHMTASFAKNVLRASARQAEPAT